MLGKHLAVFAPIPNFTLPASRHRNGRPHGGIKRPVVAARLEQGRGFAQQLALGVAQQPRHRRVDRQNAAAGIGHYHALGRVIDHGGGQALALLGVALIGHIGQHARKTLGLALCIHQALAARHKPAVNAVVAQQAHVIDPQPARGHGTAQARHHRGAFALVQAPFQPKIAVQIVALVAQHTGNAGRKIAMALCQIPVPHPAATALQRQLQARLAARQSGARGL